MAGGGSKVKFDIDHEASAISMPVAPIATERHSRFYFDDSLVIIQVENTLFRVHKFQLIKSETFSDMFKMPKGSTKEPEEGASPEHPIVLSGVKASDFDALLTVLYTFHFSNEKPKCESETTVPAFRLAHMWNFSDVRDHLLPLVKDALSCVDKIVLAKELGIQEWLAPAYMELCQRTESLTMAEAASLGLHSTVMITRLREQFRPAQSAPNSGRDGDYCIGCAGVSYHGAGYASNCRQCGGYAFPYYRFDATPSGVLPQNNAGLEDQLKKWVEGGCMTE